MPLAEHFAHGIGKRLESRAERVLLDYSWPGNARELRQVIERASQLVADGVLPPAALVEAIELGAPGDGQGWERAHCHVIAGQRAELLTACEAEQWNADRVAQALGVHRATVFRRLKRAGISLRRHS